MKIVEAVVEFVLGMIKRGVTLVTVGVILLFAVWVFAVVMPENVQKALEIFKSLVGS